jgi:spoIIIJ-associated protein
MYDAKSEPNEFVGDNRQEAVSKACRFYAVEESELKVVHTDEMSVSGLGGRSVVVALPRELVGRRPSSEGNEDRGRDDNRRDGRRDDSRREGRRDDSRRDDNRRDGRRDEGRSDRDRDSRGTRGREDTRREEAPEAAPEPKKQPVGDSKGVAKGDLGEIGQFLLGTLERMKLGSFEITELEENGVLIYQLEGPAAQLLGQDARAAEAMQLLANQAENQRSDEPMKIVVDVEGEADRREEFLSRVASRAAKRASDSGRSVALEPMNGRDRRMIHMAVRDLDAVATLSIGEGRYRQVVIVPEGAPDYEEAKKSSEATDES